MMIKIEKLILLNRILLIFSCILLIEVRISSAGETYNTLMPVSCVDSNFCNASLINQTINNWQEHGTLLPAENYVYINLSSSNISSYDIINGLQIHYDKYQESLNGSSILDWFNGTNWVQLCNQSFASETFHTHDVIECNFTNIFFPSINELVTGLQLRMNFYYESNLSGLLFGTDEVYVNLSFNTTSPVVELISPNEYSRVGQVNFTYYVNKLNFSNCTLYADFNGTFESNKTNNNIIANSSNIFSVELNQGSYLWNVLCCDFNNNCAFDTKDGYNDSGNFLVNVTFPDLMALNLNFNTSDLDLKEGMNITINATFVNIGKVNISENILVKFYYGDPEQGGTQIGQNLTLNGLNNDINKTLNITWIIPEGGSLMIYSIIDYDNLINETNENNNKINNSIHVPSYHYFYGNVENKMYLKYGFEDTLYDYGFITDDFNGTILAMSSNSEVDFSALQALGFDKNNDSSFNDFSEMDVALNMTSLVDSILKMYTDGTNVALETMNMSFLNKSIVNIPVVNSTNSSNFKTGILWDMDDGGNEYNGTQDIVFITKTNMDKEGKYGTYDYELKVPVKLKNFKEATTIKIYWEINI